MAYGEDRERVDDWYQLDENAVPPEYLLKPRTGEFKDIQRWGEVETPMQQALREAARAAFYQLCYRHTGRMSLSVLGR